MKKFSSVLLAVFMVFALVAGGSSNNETGFDNENSDKIVVNVFFH